MNAGVYVIINTVNGMGYVGSSAFLEERMEQHFHRLEQGRHHNYMLQRAFEHAGDVWACIILERCRRADLARTEQKWINRRLKFNRLYNLVLTVDRSLCNDEEYQDDKSDHRK
jgi:group I intron endonuclease